MSAPRQGADRGVRAHQGADRCPTLLPRPPEHRGGRIFRASAWSALLRARASSCVRFLVRTPPRARLLVRTPPRARLLVRTPPRARFLVRTLPRARFLVRADAARGDSCCRGYPTTSWAHLGRNEPEKSPHHPDNPGADLPRSDRVTGRLLGPIPEEISPRTRGIRPISHALVPAGRTRPRRPQPRTRPGRLQTRTRRPATRRPARAAQSLPRPSARTCHPARREKDQEIANASGAGQEHTRLRSPKAPSMRRTGGQYLSAVRPAG